MKYLIQLLFFGVAIVIGSSNALAESLIQQSTTAQPLMFLMVSSSDHITAATGATTTVTLSKNGGAFAAPAGAVTEVGNGWYKVAGNATDSNTLGPLVLHATATGADPTDVVYQVVAFNPQDSVRLGLTALPNVASGSAGAIITSGTGTAQLSVTGGSVNTVTNLTNAPTAGDLTAAMKASVTTAATAATPTPADSASLTAIKAKTDQMSFGVANQLDANTKSMNGHAVMGSGAAGDAWRGH